MLTKPTCTADVAMVRPSDIRTVLASYQGRDVAAEFIERSKEHQR
jgi:import inner membrane translocase subunit TIM50